MTRRGRALARARSFAPLRMTQKKGQTKKEGASLRGDPSTLAASAQDDTKTRKGGRKNRSGFFGFALIIRTLTAASLFDGAAVYHWPSREVTGEGSDQDSTKHT